jgi:UDP-N-acetylglucosamine acyltransferase
MGRSAQIHPTAIIDPRAELAGDVAVGAYAVIKGAVKIGAGSIIQEHTVIHGATHIGRGCKIGPAAYIGMDPQHLKFVADEANPSYLLVGDNVTIRESARVHRATHPGIDHATKIGEGCFLMGGIHVAHDCVLEPQVIMADAALLGGHCHIGQGAFIGGGSTLHQFVRIGRLVIIAGHEASSKDVPPFGAVRYGRLKGYNAIGCKRSGMDRATLTAIRACYLRLRLHRQTSAALRAIRAEVPDVPEVREIIEFIESSRRGILVAYRGSPGGSDSEAGSDEGDAKSHVSCIPPTPSPSGRGLG